MESQELLDGGDGSVTRAVLGESRTTFEQGQARTVNRILDGGSILTIFHEEAHGFRRRAHQNRSLTVADDIAILRAVDTVLAGKTTREGDKQLRLLPENFDSLSPKDQETAIDEGISRLMEAEVLRTRKGGGVRELPAGIISNNLAALSPLAGDKSVGKFRAFVRAVRAHFGLAIERASEIRRGLEDGTIHPADYHDYLSKLHGIDARQVLDAENSGDGSRRDSDGSHTIESFSLSEDPSNPQLPEIGKSLNSQKSRIPKAPGKIFSTLMMVSKAKWVDRVTQWLNTVGTVTDPDGETVLLANPEKGSLSRRARHLIGSFTKDDAHHRNDRILMGDKARTVFAVPKTVQDYQVKADDGKGTLTYIRRYQDGTLHMVLVEKASGKLKDHRLITQRALDPKGGAEGLTVQRVRASSDRSPSSPAPGQTGADREAAPRRPSADHESFTPPGRVQEETSAPPETSQDSTSYSLGSAAPRLTPQQFQQVEDLAFENAKRTRIVNTDDVRPLIPGYNEANPLNRDDAYHPDASAIASRVLQRMLAEPPMMGRVLVLAGGGGSGKSTAEGVFAPEADFTFDTTLSSPKSAAILLDQIRESGREMEVLYVHRGFAAAFENIIGRYLQGKLEGAPRIVPLAIAASAHIGAQETLFGLQGVPIIIIDNNGNREDMHIISLEKLESELYINFHESAGNSRREDAPIGHDVHSSTSGTDPQGSSEASRDHRRARSQARLEAEGRAIIEDYRSRGRLTEAEANAFLGE